MPCKSDRKWAFLLRNVNGPKPLETLAGCHEAGGLENAVSPAVSSSGVVIPPKNLTFQTKNKVLMSRPQRTRKAVNYAEVISLDGDEREHPHPSRRKQDSTSTNATKKQKTSAIPEERSSSSEQCRTENKRLSVKERKEQADLQKAIQLSMKDERCGSDNVQVVLPTSRSQPRRQSPKPLSDHANKLMTAGSQREEHHSVKQIESTINGEDSTLRQNMFGSDDYAEADLQNHGTDEDGAEPPSLTGTRDSKSASKRKSSSNRTPSSNLNTYPQSQKQLQSEKRTKRPISTDQHDATGMKAVSTDKEQSPSENSRLATSAITSPVPPPHNASRTAESPIPCINALPLRLGLSKRARVKPLHKYLNK
ncbi:uncharacterized protein SPPG_05956 [Spizellomyces punctatus DAOM BR117]|uniref:RAD51 interacting motif domain-containing protein n=1 Tax=Spizellomyces punctatus (strain DAOM BR117) TaxID=645134 RepID=A0A0L0HDC4_SPIPD|nr:uncharacterized protein SPPG_05956 [Spizellomyces punctatus DAOM BR117]KNC99006.1 hypothetical protein SPPG_05956 [Spizellomyces punctatus DAOM BR117]|eukprot:XP_016607046.1 hypothetical protein SPPG_05956 [Spizellomyces punctatus DAOM BR117]